MDAFLDLTDRFPMTFDVDRMRQEMRSAEAACGWQDHYDPALAGWTALPLVARHGRMDGPESQRWGDVREFSRTPVVAQMPYFASILDAFKCPQGRVRVLRLKPGGTIAEHRDSGGEAAGYAYNKVRLHVPIDTNDKVVFRLAGGDARMLPGRLYYCDFTQPHSVYNGGSQPRVHFVLDLVMNPFLRGLFPRTTLGEKVHHWGLRRTMPVVWGGITARANVSRRFWRAYNGSTTQRLADRLRGRPRAIDAGAA